MEARAFGANVDAANNNATISKIVINRGGKFDLSSILATRIMSPEKLAIRISVTRHKSDFNWFILLDFASCFG
jgi:hypothetical protein